MVAEINKALIRQYIDTWNRGDPQALASFWAPDIIHHTRDGSHGYEAIRVIITGIMSAFPDMSFHIDDLIAEGDKVVTRMMWRGTHTGSYMGAPPTGKKIACGLIGIARVVNGQIVEHWGVTDELHMMQQMGLLPEEVLTAMA